MPPKATLLSPLPVQTEEPKAASEVQVPQSLQINTGHVNREEECLEAKTQASERGFAESYKEMKNGAFLKPSQWHFI